MAQLKSPMLPPVGEMGYCLSFWYHMSGATVGSLRMLLQTTDPMKKTMVTYALNKRSLSKVLTGREITEAADVQPKSAKITS